MVKVNNLFQIYVLQVSLSDNEINLISNLISAQVSKLSKLAQKLENANEYSGNLTTHSDSMDSMVIKLTLNPTRAAPENKN